VTPGIVDARSLLQIDAGSFVFEASDEGLPAYMTPANLFSWLMLRGGGFGFRPGDCRDDSAGVGSGPGKAEIQHRQEIGV
jgi:hypothetical protein